MPAASTIGALTAEAWRQCYLDPARARAVGHELVELGATDIGWFHIALAEIRIGSEDTAMTALARSREAFTVSRDRCGLALCDELQAIHLRHTQDLAGSHALQRDIDGRAALDYTPVQQFIAQNSRALTAKLLGQTEEALRRFYAALDAARRSELAGPQVTALGNLGGYHQALFNRQDARLLCEQALETAQRIGARQAVGTALANLIMIQHGEGEPGQAMDTARSLEAMLPQLAPTTVGRFTTFIALACFGAGDIDGAQQRLDLAAASSVADGDGISRWAWLTARCHLARGDASAARRTAVDTLASQRPSPPYDIVELHRVAADACEVLGDVAAALAYTRSAHAHYESMVGHSARARYIALQVGHELVHARQERDDAELNLRRMAELNRALQAKIAETELLHAQLREQALRDPLTGLHNRRYLFEVGPGLIELSRRGGTPLCVAVIDLDHFKALNDDFGHLAGDMVLQRFAQLLTHGLRRSDIVCRHGGEEFVIVMPEIDVDAASQTLRRVLDDFGREHLESGRRTLPACAFSAGLAVFPRQGDGLEQLLSMADRALYRAKASGRARIETATASAT